MIYNATMKLTTRMIATMLDVTEYRVRQIAKEMNLKPEQHGRMYFFSKAQVRRMQNRNTKPGPKKGRR